MDCDMCLLVCVFIICLISLIFRNVDENNLDDYDRFWGYGDKGYSRDALGIIYEKEPDKIIVASNGSPLLIGMGKNANYISSDINALISKTKKYISLEDNEFGIITPSTNLYSISLNLVLSPAILVLK